MYPARPIPAMEPNLPIAAANPFAVERMLEGNNKDGIKKVVGAGPKPLNIYVVAYNKIVSGHQLLGNKTFDKQTKKNAADVNPNPCNCKAKALTSLNAGTETIPPIQKHDAAAIPINANDFIEKT